MKCKPKNNNRSTHTHTHTKKKQTKHLTKGGYQTIREENKRKEKKKRSTKIFKKMAIGIHISIITLYVNGSKAPTK